MPIGRKSRRKSKRGGFMQPEKKSLADQVTEDLTDVKNAVVNHPITQQVKNGILNHPITQGLVGTLNDGVSTVAGHVENLKEKTVPASLPDPNSAPVHRPVNPIYRQPRPMASPNPILVSTPVTRPVSTPVTRQQMPMASPNTTSVNRAMRGGKKRSRKHKKRSRKHKTHSRKRKTRSRSRKSRSRR